MKWLITVAKGLRVVGEEKMVTRGNDEEYPTFKLGDGSLVSAHIGNVVEFEDPSYIDPI